MLKGPYEMVFEDTNNGQFQSTKTESNLTISSNLEPGSFYKITFSNELFQSKHNRVRHIFLDFKVYWSLQFLGYSRTLSLKFQKAGTKIEVVLSLPSWLSQLNWDSYQGRLRTTSILVRAFWNFKLKVLKYSRNCSLQYTLIPWSLRKCDAP